jgi:hypothetical protein
MATGDRGGAPRPPVMTHTDMRRLFAEPPQEYAPVDCWWWEAAPRSAPASMRASTISGLPFPAATINGVSSQTSCGSRSAPASKRACSTSWLPDLAAWFNGVAPSLSCASRSAPASRRASTTSTLSPRAANINGVSSQTSRGSTSAPRRSGKAMTESSS